MQRYQSELTADTIAMFARAAKEATEGRSLVGAFYGYTMELSNNGPRALANSGHLALAKLLECPDLDMIHAPISYFERGIGQTRATSTCRSTQSPCTATRRSGGRYLHALC